MGTRAQIDIRSGNKVVRLYSQFDGFPRNILPALRAAAAGGHSTPLRIAQGIIRQLPKDFIEITEDDRREYASYHYAIDVSTKPWRVRQTREASCALPIKSDGTIDDSDEALNDPKKQCPAVTRSFRI